LFVMALGLSAPWEIKEIKFAEYTPGKGGDNIATLKDLIIRRGRFSDAVQLAEIKLTRQNGSLEEQLIKFRKELTEQENDKTKLLLVAEIRDRVIGFGRALYFIPPKDAPRNIAPRGWYLIGVIIHPDFRRMGAATQLTAERLKLISQKGESEVYYFANSRNKASIDLHNHFGFMEISRDFVFPEVTFDEGTGILFRADFDI